jgi:four helix bundle protein
MEEAKNHKELKIWQHAMDLVIRVYQVTAKYPKEEKLGLVAQMRNAAVSIPSNIAEGFGRHSMGDYCRFLYISLGSCAELETQTIISERLGYLTTAEAKGLVDILETQSKMTMSLINRVKGTNG